VNYIRVKSSREQLQQNPLTASAHAGYSFFTQTGTPPGAQGIHWLNARNSLDALKCDPSVAQRKARRLATRIASGGWLFEQACRSVSGWRRVTTGENSCIHDYSFCFACLGNSRGVQACSLKFVVAVQGYFC